MFKQYLTRWVERTALNCRAYNGNPGSCGCGCPPPGGCVSGGPAATPTPGGGRRPPMPQDCRPTRIPYNPCCPKFHEGHDTWKKFKYFALFLLLPVIAAHTFNCLGHCPPAKGECRDYEYMRIRSKRFPWGDGIKSLFHNDHVNHLPGECTDAPMDCD